MERTYRPTSGSDALTELRGKLHQTQVDLMRRLLEAGSQDTAPCQQHVQAAQQHAAAAQAALAAGNLKTCQQELDLGFAEVAAGEACIFLERHPPL